MSGCISVARRSKVRRTSATSRLPSLSTSWSAGCVAAGSRSRSSATSPTSRTRSWPGRARPACRGGPEHAEGVVRGGELLLVALGPGPPRHAGLARPGQDLVLDVGDVADERDLESAATQPADQDVESDGSLEVADVRRTLDRRATEIQPDMARAQGHQLAHGAGGGVEQA